MKLWGPFANSAPPVSATKHIPVREDPSTAGRAGPGVPPVPFWAVPSPTRQGAPPAGSVNSSQHLPTLHTMGSVRLGKTSEIIRSKHPPSTAYTIPPNATATGFLITSRDGDSTPALGILPQ